MGIVDTLARGFRGLSISGITTTAGIRDFEQLGLVGPEATSGVRVNADTALEYAPLWRGINLLSRDIAKLPAQVFKRVGEDGRERDRKHAAHKLLNRRPNPMMSPMIAIQTIQANAVLHQNGFAFVVRDAAAQPTRLIPLPTPWVELEREDGVFTYWFNVNGEGERVPIAPENMIHVKGLTLDGLWGISLIQKARNSIGLGMGAEEYGARFFGNDATPHVVLEHPGVKAAAISDQAAQNIVTSWDNKQRGLERAHRTTVLGEGMTARVLGISGRDAQLVQTRQFELIQVANWVGVPPHKLGSTISRSFASIEQENLSYLSESIDPWLVVWEQELTDKLLTEAEKENDTHFIEFNRGALVRADIATRAGVHSLALAGKPWKRVNEVRKDENMPPDDELDAMATKPPEPPPMIPPPVDDDGDQDEDADVDDDQDTDDRAGDLQLTHLRIIVGVVERMAKRVGVGARTASKSCMKEQPHGRTFIEWFDGGCTQLPMGACGRLLADMLHDPCRAYGLAMKQNSDNLRQQITAGCVGDWHKRFLQATDAQPEQFAEAVKRAAESIERDAAALAASLIGRL